MPLPKRRHSHTRGAKRRTHYVATLPSLRKCAHCSQLKPSHKVCPHCGYYRGRQYFEPKEA